MRKSIETYKKWFVDPNRLKNGTPDMFDAQHIVWAALKRCEKLSDAEEFIKGQVCRRTKKLNNQGWSMRFSMPLAEFSGFVTVSNADFEHVVRSSRSWIPELRKSSPDYPWHAYRWRGKYNDTPLPLSGNVSCDGDAEEIVDFLLTDQNHKGFSFYKDYPCNIYNQYNGEQRDDKWIERAVKQPHKITIEYSKWEGGAAGNERRFESVADRYTEMLLTVWALFRMLDVQPAEPTPEEALYAPIPVTVDHFAAQQRQLIERARIDKANAEAMMSEAQQKIGYFQQLESKIKNAFRKRGAGKKKKL